MTAQEITEFCLAQTGAYEDSPFGEYPVCFRLKGRIFAQLYPDKITLKCSRGMGEFLRQAYPGRIVRGYHCPPVQQPYWNTLSEYESFPDEELRSMITHAWQTVFDSLPKKVQKEIIHP